jgi:hypothetical protein
MANRLLGDVKGKLANLGEIREGKTPSNDANGCRGDVEQLRYRGRRHTAMCTCKPFETLYLVFELEKGRCASRQLSSNAAISLKTRSRPISELVRR